MITPWPEEIFKDWFDKRLFNPPLGDSDFNDEFDAAVDSVQAVLEKHAPSEVFSVFGYHNRSRFIDVAFDSEEYLNPELIWGLQSFLKSLPEPWMVCLWQACFIFVTPVEITGFDPTGNDPQFRRLLV